MTNVAYPVAVVDEIGQRPIVCQGSRAG